MVEPLLRRVAEILCEFDPLVRDPYTIVYSDAGKMPVWQTRLQMARQVLRAIEQHQSRATGGAKSRQRRSIKIR